MSHYYYYNIILKVLKFLIPKEKSILYYGYYNKEFSNYLKSNYLVCINEDKTFVDSQESPNIVYIYSKLHEYVPERKFDFVVLDIALGMTDDMCLLLKNVSHACMANTRIIIHQENYLWQPILKIAAWLGLKNKEKTRNWLSAGDIQSYLYAFGFETTRMFNKNMCPVKLGFIGPMINSLFSYITLFDWLKLDQFIITRFTNTQLTETDASLTICLTVRDEEDNIEPIVATLPLLSANQEILFVEGHSKDNTVSEIKRMQAVYPEKNIRLIHQEGIGQGDAIRIGFHLAQGDIIILYEGDGTSDPSDIQHFYECMKQRKYQFIEGSRFSYPLVSQSMPLINKIGNMLFAKWFTLFLKQRTTDVLSGIKAIRKSDYEIIYDSWGFLNIDDPFGDFELLYGSVRYGLRIGEIPMHYKPRDYGVSKTKAIKHGMHLIKMAWKGFVIFRKSKI